jgi:hypothetical protein
MKTVFEGWMSKSYGDLAWWQRSGNVEWLEIPRVIFRRKGFKRTWDEADWPPRRAKVTIEVVDDAENGV